MLDHLRAAQAALDAALEDVKNGYVLTYSDVVNLGKMESAIQELRNNIIRVSPLQGRQLARMFRLSEARVSQIRRHGK